MMQSRTHTCGQLRIENAGEHVTLVGWMENVRVVGNNFAFIVLRDFYGTTQIVVETSELLAQIKGYNKESTISVEGTVRERASKNPNQPTGDIEVVPEKIELLGRCRYNSLPFEINRSREADETQRLKYRYLDLRNPAVKKNIILRCNVIAALRQAMMAHDFLEITTPILTASSPEGARDYLVPARKHPGKFYALPQAPQQFKQLLMTSGFDRYFQIAPCFRDEDARGDRSPGEFYQLDMEMAFAAQDDVFAVIEDVLPPIFAKYGKYNIASSAPFRRIAYKDALETYGSDKPDLRIDLTCKNISDLFESSEFEPFKGQTVKAVPISNCHLTRKQIEKLLTDCEVQAGTKGYWFKMDENGELAGGVAKFVQGCKDELTARLGLQPNTLVLVAAGVSLFVWCGFKNAPYEFIDSEPFETEYGVHGMVTEKKKNYRGTYAACNIAATCICILSIIPLFLSILLKGDLLPTVLLLCLTILLAGVGVVLFILCGVRWASMAKLLQEADYAYCEKEKNGAKEAVARTYWSLAVAIYLGWSFLSGRWGITWVVWPLAGVLYAALSSILQLTVWRSEDSNS